MLPPRAYVFLGLNAVRALSIIALLLVFSSSIFVMVHDIEAVNQFVKDGSNATSVDSGNYDYIENSTVPNQPAGAFWAVLNRLLIIGQTIVLILSEVGWPAVFFDRFFPVLGKDFGVGALGVMQCLIGASVLSHFVSDFPLVAAFFLFAIGCLNILVGLIFRERSKMKRSILSWRERAKDVLPSHVRGVDIRPVVGTVSSIFSRDEKAGDPAKSPSAAGLGFGRQGESGAALKGFLINKPVEALARHAT
ncbi:hypothetical protein BV22DRAFT_1032095 [Leucogyrophana mollusca]|uniref:Uncharacterized protein n=1 Tax=Leucogyrophana mollusca TaxID=85980 RepID=A0ACB8BNY9_9AGAM|nr:hypothetical protein BV22DRAFT_1032095 [Leucogyrophana mollusca]